MAWAKNFDRCRHCGTTSEAHRAKGLCVRCYERLTGEEDRSHITRKRGQRLPEEITPEELARLYHSGLSLLDIARYYNCTRQYIHKRMKQFGIRRRELAGATGAVRLALARHGRPHVTYENEAFFSSWTPAMAYVTGVICADGCLVLDTKSIVISQKDKELLEKVRGLVECDAEIHWRPARGVAGAVHTLRFANVKMYNDLLSIGLTPKKSLTLSFPTMPPDCVRHFIRGCWDGDGSIYVERGDPSHPRAHYVSGSRSFLARMVDYLSGLGLPRATIHEEKRGQAVYIKYGRFECAKLYHLFYDGVDASMYLGRKHAAFKRAAELAPLPLEKQVALDRARERRLIRRLARASPWERKRIDPEAWNAWEETRKQLRAPRSRTRRRPDSESPGESPLGKEKPA